MRMSRRHLDETLEVIAELDRARSPAAVCEAVLRATRRFGVEHVLAGTIPTPGTDRGSHRAHVILEQWPSEWMERYFSCGYLERDPTVRRVVAAAPAFRWDDLQVEEPVERRVMDEARDFQLGDGITVPLVTLEGNAAGFSLAGERIDVAPQDHGAVSLIATYALGRALMLDEATPVLTLSAREREALQWAAEGKTEWEMGVLMGISEHGADKHMRSVRVKLGASSAVHAVAKGIRLGLIG
jgi:LuxR family quorum sensing-dependent transcriptional regulator